MKQYEYWEKATGGKFRTCRKKKQHCQYRKNGFICNKLIDIGDRYFDTNERTQSGIFATYHYCIDCANREA